MSIRFKQGDKIYTKSESPKSHPFIVQANTKQGYTYARKGIGAFVALLEINKNDQVTITTKLKAVTLPFDLVVTSYEKGDY